MNASTRPGHGQQQCSARKRAVQKRIAAAMMTWKDHDDFETINAIVQPLLEEFGPGGLSEHCRELLAATATSKRVRAFAESIVKVTEFYSALAGGHRVGQPAAE